MAFFYLFILYSYAFAAEITEFNKNIICWEDPGVQRLYLDTKTIVKNKHIATIAVINLFIKDGKLYKAYKSKFPKQKPSHSISEMELNCERMQIRVKEFKLYNSADEIIANYSVDKNGIKYK